MNDEIQITTSIIKQKTKRWSLLLNLINALEFHAIYIIYESRRKENKRRAKNIL